LTIAFKYISGRFNLGIKRKIVMFEKKNKQFKKSPNKSNLDQVLWFIENYLDL